MLAALTREMPQGSGWLYEPKWDGFRAIVFWDGDEMLIQSRDLKPLNRYFPELDEGLRQALAPGLVVDGEVVIAGPDGLDWDALSLRIHPAASRIKMLAAQTPASFVAFEDGPGVVRALRGCWARRRHRQAGRPAVSAGRSDDAQDQAPADC